MSSHTRDRIAPAGPDVRELIPRTEADRRARSEALLAALDAVEAVPADQTDSPEVWAEVYRGIDEGRPERPLFEGRY
jgi:hypothetical protein